MKRSILTFTFCILLISLTAQTRHVITNAGLQYTPDSLVVMVGDTIEFNVGPSHPTTEVSQNTWQSNGSSSNGGFDFSNGQGEFIAQSQGTLYYVCVNHVSSGMKGRIFVSPGIGTEERALRELSVYPNPVKNDLFIEMELDPSSEKAGIYNLQGQLVKTVELQSFSNQQRLNTSALAAGTYILRLENNNTAQEIRFVKQ